MWDTDWATCEQPTMRSRKSIEVCELNGTPTWLARLQHRQARANRAGKLKFAHRIGGPRPVKLTGQLVTKRSS